MSEKKGQGISIDVQLPEGITSTLTESVLSLKGQNGEISRDFFSPLVKVTLNGNIVSLSTRSPKRNFKKILNTLNAHVNNMIRGVNEGFTYELKICSGHFPMTVKKEGEEVVISNFLGEKIPRKSKIIQGVNLEVKGDMIIVKSPDREKAGQTAANLEKATFIKKRDRRIFQDGCYIVSKPTKQ
jgi:large subunit ribosomal protein L6